MVFSVQTLSIPYHPYFSVGFAFFISFADNGATLIFSVALVSWTSCNSSAPLVDLTKEDIIKYDVLYAMIHAQMKDTIEGGMMKEERKASVL